MEERKAKERAHYDALAERWSKRAGGDFAETDIEHYDINFLSSYAFARELLLMRASGKKVLDYGCGHGMHAIPPAEAGAEVTGIDFSEKSLAIARKRAKKKGVAGRTKFIAMDCEALEFPPGSFDLVFDGGTFSSLDIEKAYSEISRVLTAQGALIGIETFGHNPLANLKRWLNKKRSIRTEWAAGHIMKTKDVELAREYFRKREVRYFHLLSLFAFPLRNLAGGRFLFGMLEAVDSALLKAPFLQRYAFKIVFVFSEPIKK